MKLLLVSSPQVVFICGVPQGSVSGPTTFSMSSTAVPKPSPTLSVLDNLSISSLLSGDLDEDGERADEDLGDLEVNPYDGLPYSSRYYSLLEERKQLPVWSLKLSLLEHMESHSMIVLSADGGTGKSTQVFMYIASQTLTASCSWSVDSSWMSQQFLKTVMWSSTCICNDL